jgi:hypothetical protein
LFLPKNFTMNIECYEQVLKGKLLPFMGLHKSGYFLEDGAPCHAEKRIKKFLETYNFKTTLLQKVLKTKLSSGKLHFWEWEKTLLVPDYFFPRPCWYITFLHAGNVFRHGGM